MLPHFPIHGWREQNRSARCESDGGKRMMSQSVREFGDDVRCCWRDQQQVRAIGELDVSGSPAFLFIEEAGGHRILRKRLQSERRNKFSRVLCHHDKNFVALFDQQTRELSRLVRSNRSRYAEHDRFCAWSNAHNFSRARFVAFSFRISAFCNHFWTKRRLK